MLPALAQAGGIALPKTVAGVPTEAVLDRLPGLAEAAKLVGAA
jgi:hypothetical protein